MEHTTAALVLDLLLGAVMLICVVSCYKRGFVSSLLRLVGAAAACVAAALLSRPVGSWLYDTFARERVHSYVEEKVASVLGGAAQDGLEALGGMRDAALDALSDLLEHFDFDIGFFSGEGTSGAAEKALEKLADGAGTAQAITEAAVEPAILNIFSAAVFVVIFLFGLFLARALVRMTRAVNHVPLIGGINRLAGFLLGLVYALLIGYVFSMAALLLSGALGDRVPLLRTSVLSQTYLLRWFIGLRI